MATFSLPNTQTGGSQQIQAGSLAEAQNQAQSAGTWSPAAGTYGSNSVGAFTPGAATPGPSSVTPGSSQQLAGGINNLLGAIASGNKQAFDEQVREFNQSFGLDQQKFQDDIRRFNQNFAVSEAGTTGMYQGQPTLQAAKQAADLLGYYQAPGTGGVGGAASPLAGYAPGTVVRTGANQFGVVGPGGTVDTNPNNPAIYQAIQAGAGIATVPDAAFAAGQQPGGMAGVPTMAREQQTYAQQMGMINQAATLQANPFRQQQAIGQMGRLLGGQGVAGFSAPNTVAGVGTAGGNTQGGMGYLSQMINDIRDPTPNQTSMNDVLNGIPTPNKINSGDFLRSAPSTQNLVLQGMSERYGIDPADALNQIKATLPQFTAPQTVGTIRRG